MQRMECPNCGAPLAYTGERVLTCDYCTSQLQLESQPVSQAAPALTDLQSSTAYLAKDALYRRTKEELEQLRRAYAAAVEQYTQYEAQNQPKGPGCVISVIGVLGAFLMLGSLGTSEIGDAFCTGAIGVFMVFVFLLVLGNVQAQKRRHRKELELRNQALTHMQGRINEYTRRLQQLKAELDRMVSDL
ncbi:MAG: hypothetical protein ACOYEW_09260 [Anaerolineae bacterium]|jgi:DNA repair exonuclease SbcCD ATPase subunit